MARPTRKPSLPRCCGRVVVVGVLCPCVLKKLKSYTLRVRLMVGHIPLEDGIGVRVPDPQQKNRIRCVA